MGTPNDLLNSEITKRYDQSGVINPSIVPTIGAPGTTYRMLIDGEAKIFLKIDEGISTNWQDLTAGGGGAVNLGSGAQILKNILSGLLQLRSITGDSFISVNQNANDIGIGFNYTNIDNTSDLNKPVSAAQQTALNLKEDLTNKAVNFTTINNTLYPTVQAVNNAINSAVVGLLDYRGSYDASTNIFPTTGGSGIAGTILKGDFWICSVTGTLGGIVVSPGDLIIALIDTPAQTPSNWDLISHNINYVPENISNKATNLTLPDNTKYPTTLAVSNAQALDLKIAQNLADLSNAATARTNLGVNTTANIAASTNKNYLTDAQLIQLSQTSLGQIQALVNKLNSF